MSYPSEESGPDAAHQERCTRARRRYAGFWQGAVLQDWFSVIIFPSSDTQNLREVDIASSVPEIAAAVANLRGGVYPSPRDLLIGIGSRMGNLNEPNDPEIWAAIDVGEFVCRVHFNGAERLSWNQNALLLSATSIVAFCAHAACRDMTYTVVDGANAATTVMPKVHLLVDILVITAATTRPKYEGPKSDPKKLKDPLDEPSWTAPVADFCDEHELSWQIITTMAQIALEWQHAWSGPLETIRIAQIAGDLLAEAARRATVPPVVPAPGHLGRSHD